MPTKQEVITELATQTAQRITRSGEDYMAFLTSAANNFKYSFQDQLLIFAQKPEATACAEIEFWNRHGRWVNRGTTGIALLRDTDAPYKLRYVFDMSDTNSRIGRTVPVWQMREQDKNAVIEALANRYGTAPDASSLQDSLLETAKVIAEDNLSDYFIVSLFCTDVNPPKEYFFIEVIKIMPEERRARRTAEQMAQARKEKIMKLEESILDIEKKKAEAIAAYDERIAAAQSKIETLKAANEQKKAKRKPAKKRRSQAEKVQEIVKMARKSGLSLDEIAQKLGVENE